MHIRIKRWIRKLQRDFPLRCPVSVRTVADLKNPDNEVLFGCLHAKPDQPKPDSFLIHLDRNRDVDTQIDTLWHEWTHCLLWPRCKFRHTKRFWETYGRIFSHYQDAK